MGARMVARNFFTALFSILMLVAMAVPGYALRKAGMVSDRFAKDASTFLTYGALPCLIFSAITRNAYEPALLANLGLAAALTAFLYAAVYFIGRAALRRFPDTPEKRALVSCAYLNNCAFIGIPVLQALFPGESEPILYTVVFMIVYNFLSWTLLVYTITGDRKHMSLKSALLNPPTVVTAVALPLFFLNVEVPAQVMTTLDFLGDTTTPLSMAIMGIRLAEAKREDLALTPQLGATAAVKLVASPLFTLGALLALRLLVPIDPTLLLTCYVIMAMPSGAAVILFSEMFHGDGAAASRAVLLTTVLCVLTIPASMLLRFLA